MTEAGLATIDAAFEAHMANEARLVGMLDAADRAALESLLRRWLPRPLTLYGGRRCHTRCGGSGDQPEVCE